MNIYIVTPHEKSGISGLCVYDDRHVLFHRCRGDWFETSALCCFNVMTNCNYSKKEITEEEAIAYLLMEELVS